MKAYKFVVGPTFVPLPSDPSYQVASCAAVVISSTPEGARALLRADLLAHGEAPWSDVAEVTEFAIDELPTVVLVVQG